MIRRVLLRLSAVVATAVFGMTQPAGAVIDLPGASAATFDWAPAGGPVAGYLVYLSLNGSAENLYSTVSGGTSETVQGSLGDEISVSVAAFDAEGNQGPLSPPSELVRFVAAPEPGLPGPTPPGGDPPADAPPESPPPETGPAAPLDFNGDGFSDLLLHNRDTGQVLVWTMGEGSLLGESALPDLQEGWWIAGNGDYDGDGVADVLLREEATGNLQTWLIRDGSLAAEGAVLESSGADWEVAGSSDYDGDGRADVLLRNRALGRLELWFLNGTEIAGVTGMEDPFGEGSEVVGNGDYDGDGRADILWQRGQDLHIWLLGAGSQILEVPLSLPSASWTVAGTGDYDGDGQSDILERNVDTGELAASLVVDAEVIQRGLIDTWSNRRRMVVAGGDYDGDGRVDIVVGFPERGGHRILLMSGAGLAQKKRLPRLAEGWFFEGVGQEGLAVYP